ncbi:MAG: undecaprenyl-phosphate glucose phosphotransferase [Alphaproteobacteria bacterium]|nr:undecaprenyl-phosphate glucose phosphotransferase [Alphaproteobacteria bacterium]
MPTDDYLFERHISGESSASTASYRGHSSGLKNLEFLPGLLAVSDWLGVALAGAVCGELEGSAGGSIAINPLTIIFAATLTVDYLYLLGGYQPRSCLKFGIQQAKAATAWAASIISLSALLALVGRSEEAFSTATKLWYVAGFLYLALMRCFVGWRLEQWRRRGLLLPKVAVVGSVQAAVDLARRLRQSPDARVVGVFAEEEASSLPEGVSGTIDAVVSLAAAGAVDEIVFASPWRSSRPLELAVAKFAALQTVVKIDPGLPMQKPAPVAFGFLAGVPILTLQRPPLSGWPAAAKRAEDVIISLLAIALLAPFLALVAIAIKLDTPGPVLFRQERFGFNNNRFLVFKFRTMRHYTVPDPLVQQARRNDPRVTRVGALLRRWSVDELPQLFNVLRGEMSLVGPRPHAATHNEKYALLVDGYLARHRMKPGITGWAQVNGSRGETESPQQMARRLEYDLAYIANWSLYFDLKILVITVPAVLRGTNAY